MPVENNPNDPNYTPVDPGSGDTPGPVVSPDQPIKTIGTDVIDALLKAAEDLNALEVRAVDALVEIAQLRAKSNVMAVEVTFAKGLFQDRYNKIPGDLRDEIQRYLDKVGDGTKELTKLDAVEMYGLELYVRNQAIREIVQAAAESAFLGRDAVNIAKILGWL